MLCLYSATTKQGAACRIEARQRPQLLRQRGQLHADHCKVVLRLCPAAPHHLRAWKLALKSSMQLHCSIMHDLLLGPIQAVALCPQAGVTRTQAASLQTYQDSAGPILCARSSPSDHKHCKLQEPIDWLLRVRRSRAPLHAVGMVLQRED